MGITWLASYPKSGNTWVRFILHHALFGEPKRSLDINKRIPDLHRRLPDDALARPSGDGPLLVKTHLQLTARHPELAGSVGALHIVRDPRDVLLSALNYRRLNGVTESQLSGRAYAEQFIRAGGDPAWKSQGMGTWASHAASWSGADRFPVVTIRYEDLKRDALRVMRDACAALGLDIPEDKLAPAVSASEFDKLRALEVREKATSRGQEGLFVGDQKAARQGLLFMNTGRTGQSLDEAIEPGLDRMLEDTLGEAMARFGYTPRS